MDNRSWLLLDVSYLAHRAMYTTGDLSYKGDSTGALYGLFRTVFHLRKKFGTDYVCWCFDDRTENLFRKKDYPPYKAKRGADHSIMDPKWVQNKKELVRQIRDLHKEHLLSAGCVNVGFASGYEADDVIAWYVQGLQKEKKVEQTAIIVSADEDLYQLLGRYGYTKTILYNPTKKETVTENTFHRTHGFSPKLWAKYKALAGCKSDNISGIRGIGPKTAEKYLRRETVSEPLLNLIKKSKETIAQFEELTRLPYHEKDVEPPKAIKDEEESSQAWKGVFRKLGFFSFTKKD